MKLFSIKHLDESVEQILVEAKNYNEIFNVVLSINSQLKSKVETNIKWAKKTLKREDRIIWFLRIVKLKMLMFAKANDELTNAITTYNKKAKGSKVTPAYVKSMDLTDIKRNLEHYMGMDYIPKIVNHKFKWENPDELFTTLRQFEQENQQDLKDKGLIEDEGHPVFLKLDGTFVWLDLNTSYCSLEAKAMGHCGNAGGRSSDTILSLRKIVDVNGATYYEPHATFIMSKDGILGEMKGKENNKPSKKYHKYIVPLLMDKRIKGIKGGGYLPESNFSINDLPDGVRNKLAKDKPTLMEVGDYIEVFGFDDHIMKIVGQTVKLDKKDKKHPIIIHEYKNVFDFLDDHGDDLSKWIGNLMNGDESVEIHDFYGDVSDIKQYTSNKDDDWFAYYAETKYPDEYEEYGLDWFNTLNEMDDPVIYEFQNALRQAQEVGTESDAIDTLLKELKNLKYGVENKQYSDVNAIMEWQTNDFWDGKVVMKLNKDSINSVLAGHDLTDLEDALSDYRDEVKFSVEEPRYGFSGFDDEVCKEMISEIVNDVKVQLKKMGKKV